MSNTNKTHTKSDKHDEHFMKYVEKSTFIIEHEIAELPDAEGKVPDLEELLKKNNKKKS